MNRKSANRRGASTPTMLPSLKKNNNVNPETPSLRGNKNPVIPGIKNNKAATETKKEAVAQFSELLKGKYMNLPPKTPKEVRVFMSSTFTDMKTERNTLAKCYNELKDFCQSKYNIDFSVVDMRWGVTDEASNDHSTEEVCIREIENCKQVGLGPTFVTILGDRYGTCIIPKYICGREFEVIIQYVSDDKAKSLIEKWYKKDLNAVPPHYLLQPIKSIIPSYGKNSETIAEWNQILSTLTSGLRTGVEKAHTAGKLSDDKKHVYNMSVTESEVMTGIKQNKDPDSHCMAFIRTFMGLNDDVLNEANSSAARHTDILTSQGKKILDTEAEKYRNTLRNKTIPAIIPKSRLRKYEPLIWYPDGVTLENHKTYLENLSKDFTNGVKELIQTDQKNVSQESINEKFKSNYDEIVHHLYFCRSKCETFVGREDVLTEVKEYLSNDKINSPLILHAESGGGKTSVMAKIFEKLPMWFGNNTIRVIRFLGTSPLSSNIYDVLKSLVHQLADITGEILQPSNCKTMKSMLNFLPRFLRNIKRNAGGKVVVLFDSIDQLSIENDAHNMKWLNTTFPKDFYMIISTLPNMYNILKNCRKRGLSSKNMIEVKSLEIDAGKMVIDSHLKRQKRCLQPDQEKLILDAFKKVSNVLFLKLALDKSMKWQSYTPLTGLNEVVGSSVKDSIREIFTSLENQYGKVLVSHSLGYITAGNGGLSTVEIEDVLPIDDEVLNDVYVYHPPPVPGVVRIPPLLWARIQYSIREYLVEHSSHGKNTLFWYHRQFIETATETYLPGDTGNAIHKKLAKLFLAENGIQEDITLSKLRKVQTVKSADRQITKQPLSTSNIRSLMCIPFHLRNAGNFHQMKTSCMFRLEFILTKIEALGVESFLEDIQKMTHSKSQPDQDFETLLACFEDINTDERNPKVIVSEIIARIPDVSWLPYGSSLVKQCCKYFSGIAKGFLLPLHSCLYNKADLVNTWNHVVAMPSHYGDYLSVELEPGFTKNMWDCEFALLDISSNLLTINSSFEYHPILLKERNTALAHGNFYVGGTIEPHHTAIGYFSIQGFYNHTKLSYDQITQQIDTQNTKLPGIDIGPGGRHTFNIESSLVGRDEIYWEQTVTAEESSSKGNYMSLVFGKNIIIHRTLSDQFDNNHISTRLFFDDFKKFIQGSKDMTDTYTCFDIVVKIRGKDEQVTEHRTQNMLELQASGNDPHVLYANYLEHTEKTMYVLEYTADDEIYTSICLLNPESITSDQFSLLGQIIVRKWLLLKDETCFATSLYDSNSGVLMFLVVGTEELSPEVLKLPIEGRLLDVSYSCIGEMRGYALTDKALYCMDLINKEPVSSVKNDYSTATYMTVEDDGEYMYIGNSTGRIDCIKVQGFEYLGYVDLLCGSIDKIVLSASDVNLIVHGTNKQLVSMSQKHFTNKCRANRQLKVVEHGFSVALDFYTDAELLMLVTKTAVSELVTFQKGEMKVWSLQALNEPKSVPYEEELKDFIPKKMHFNGSLNPNKCLLMTVNTAVLIDTVTWSSKTVGNLEGGAIVASTQAQKGFYIVTSVEEKLNVYFLPYSSSDVSKVISLKESLKGSIVDICVTASQKYMAIKMECPDKEYDIINQAVSKMSGAVMGRNKFYCLDLSNEKVTPCNRHMNKLLLLADTFAIYQEHTILLGVDKEIHLWDMSTGIAKTQFMKGTKNSMFFTTNPERLKDKPGKQASNKDIYTRHLETCYNGKECQIVCIVTNECFVNIYKGSGEVVYNSGQNRGGDKRGKVKCQIVCIVTNECFVNIYKGSGEVVYNSGQNRGGDKRGKICHVWIAPDSSWIATVCESRILRLWSTKNKKGQLSQILLDVTVTQGFIDQSSSYIAVLGDRSDQGTKVLLFKVVI